MASPDGHSSPTLDQVLASAADPLRLSLLQGAEDWFRAIPEARRLGVNRGSVARHAHALAEAGLLEQREVMNERNRPTTEWRILPAGRATAASIIGLAAVNGPVPPEAPPAADARSPISGDSYSASLYADLETGVKEKVGEFKITQIA